MPASLQAILRDKSRELGLPVSRLITIAVDNELDAHEPFKYDVELPKVPYEEYAYAGLAGRLLEFLAKFPKGAGLDMLVLARRDVGATSKMDLLFAFRELLEKKIIEGFYPVGTKFTFYNSSYKYYRALLGPDKKPKKKFKRVEEQSTKHMRPILDKDVG